MGFKPQRRRARFKQSMVFGITINIILFFLKCFTLLFISPVQQFSDLDQMFVVEREELELGRVLGRGAFGEVYAGKLKRVGWSP